MKISFDEIPEEGTLDLDFLENESKINKFFDDSREGGFSFASPAKCSFKLSKSGKTVFVSLHVEACARSECSQCLVEFEKIIDIHNDTSLFPEEAAAEEEEGIKELDLTREELEKNFYSSNSIDLTALLCEEIVLSLPLNPRCSDDCKGLCPSCGKNLNEGKCKCNGTKKENPFAVLKDIKF